MNLSTKKLIQDVTTRWNSTYYMMERLYEEKSAVAIYASENSRIENLTATQWTLTENCITLLKPFEEITKQISSTESIISEVIPTLAALRRYLCKTTFTGVVGRVKDSLIGNLNHRFENIEENLNFAIPTFVDPRFKLTFFNETKKKIIRGKILESLVLVDSTDSLQIGRSDLEVENISADCSSNCDELPIATIVPSKRLKLSVWQCLTEIATDELQNPSTSVGWTIRDAAEREVDMYLASAITSRDDSPFEWWKTNKNSFPMLSKLALKYLCTPASTIYSERLFSEAGNVYEAKRNRLLPENGEQLIFLHHNLPLLNYKL